MPFPPILPTLALPPILPTLGPLQAWVGAGNLKWAVRTLTYLLNFDSSPTTGGSGGGCCSSAGGSSGGDASADASAGGAAGGGALSKDIAREARRMLYDVQQRRQQEKAMYAGVCDRKGFCQTSEEAAAVEAREAAAMRTKPKDALAQRFDAYAAYERQRSLGFKWEAVGTTRPADGVEIHNRALAEALGARKEFTWVELDEWGVDKELHCHHFIMAGGKCYQPRGRDD